MAAVNQINKTTKIRVRDGSPNSRDGAAASPEPFFLWCNLAKRAK